MFGATGIGGVVEKGMLFEVVFSLTLIKVMGNLSFLSSLHQCVDRAVSRGLFEFPSGGVKGSVANRC